MRRPRRKVDPVVGRDEFFIVSRDGRIRAKHAAPSLALIEAQNRALIVGKDGDTFTVTRKTLVGYGPEVALYRVVREEDGSVSTHTLSRED